MQHFSHSLSGGISPSIELKVPFFKRRHDYGMKKLVRCNSVMSVGSKHGYLDRKALLRHLHPSGLLSNGKYQIQEEPKGCHHQQKQLYSFIHLFSSCLHACHRPGPVLGINTKRRHILALPGFSGLGRENQWKGTERRDWKFIGTFIQVVSHTPNYSPCCIGNIIPILQLEAQRT